MNHYIDKTNRKHYSESVWGGKKKKKKTSCNDNDDGGRGGKKTLQVLSAAE